MSGQSEDVASPEARAPLPPGDALRRAREARALTVAEVAEALKLRPRQVEAIESGDFASFKGFAYARGFVRNYARHLQIDPQPLLAAMSEVSGGEAVSLTPPSNADGEMPRGAAMRGVPVSLAVLAVVALIALVAVVLYDRSPFPLTGAGAPARPAPPVAATATAPVGAPMPAAVQPAPPAIAALAPAAQPPVAPNDAHRLRLRFSKKAWVEITDGSGAVLLSGTEPAGSERTLEGKPPLSLVIGNADAVELLYGDRVVDLAPHSARNVARLRLE